MTRLGGETGVVAALNGQTLRLVGLAFVGWASAVVSASVTSDVGLRVSNRVTTTAVADLGTVPALVEFSLAHPAYPALLLVGLVLLVLGEDAPLA